MPGMGHPWRRLRELGEWLLGWAPLPGDLRGLTDYHARIIILDPRLTQAERRCTVAHELEHVHRGPVPGWMVPREEEAIERAVARRLIPLDRLADALAWTQDAAEAAEELWVDIPTLEARMRGLHPAERAHLRARLGHHEIGA